MSQADLAHRPRRKCGAPAPRDVLDLFVGRRSPDVARRVAEHPHPPRGDKLSTARVAPRAAARARLARARPLRRRRIAGRPPEHDDGPVARRLQEPRLLGDDLPRALLRLSLSERADDLPDGSGLARSACLPSTLSHLELCGFGGLTSFEGIPNALSSLSLCHCEGFTTLDGLSDSLQHIHLVDCHGLTDLAGLPARLLRRGAPLRRHGSLRPHRAGRDAVGLRLPPPPASALSSVGAEASAHDLGVWVRPSASC